jgi:hypothetical protein
LEKEKKNLSQIITHRLEKLEIIRKAGHNPYAYNYDKTQIGSVLLASSLVADIQLLAAVIVWTVVEYTSTMTSSHMATIISLSGGAFLANITSVILYLGETLKSKR